MKKSTPVQWFFRVLIYCLGLLLMAFGVALSVSSDLGVSPVNSLPYVVSRILNVPMGRCVTVIFCFYILLQAVVLGRDFPLLNLLQIVASTLFGYFVDFAKAALAGFVLPTYFGKLAMLAASIVLIALGMTLYMGTHISSMPMEGLSSALAKKLQKPFPFMKTVTDCSPCDRPELRVPWHAGRHTRRHGDHRHAGGQNDRPVPQTPVAGDQPDLLWRMRVGFPFDSTAGWFSAQKKPAQALPPF